jgi:hypothetical protein
VIRSVIYLAQHGRRSIASAKEWPRNAPETGGWIELEL